MRCQNYMLLNFAEKSKLFCGFWIIFYVCGSSHATGPTRPNKTRMLDRSRVNLSNHGAPNNIPRYPEQHPTVAQTISNGTPNYISRYSDRAHGIPNNVHGTPRYSKQCPRYPTVLARPASLFLTPHDKSVEPPNNGAAPYICIGMRATLPIYR